MFERSRAEITDVRSTLAPAADLTRADLTRADLTRAELNEAVAELIELRSSLDAVEAQLLATWEKSLAWTDDGSSSPTAWLKHNTGLRGSTGTRQLKLARFLRKYQCIADRLAAGDITLDHVTQLARLNLPRLTKRFDSEVAVLIEFAVELSADQFAAVCRQWLTLADQDDDTIDADDATRQQFEKRSLHLSQLLDLTWKLDAILDAETGAMLADSIAKLALESTEADAAAVTADPTLQFHTTPAQRRVDAFSDLIARALGVDLGTTVGPRNSLNVIIDDDALANGGDGVTDNGAGIGAATIERLFCDCDLHGVILKYHPDGNIDLSLGRAIRLANRAQRRALAARDHGCRFPGCDRPIGWTVAHHIIWWENDGPTDINNLISLCRHHHYLVHEGGWTLTRTDDGEHHFSSPSGKHDHTAARTRRRLQRRANEHLGNREQRQLSARARRRLQDLRPPQGRPRQI